MLNLNAHLISYITPRKAPNISMGPTITSITLSFSYPSPQRAGILDFLSVINNFKLGKWQNHTTLENIYKSKAQAKPGQIV